MASENRCLLLSIQFITSQSVVVRWPGQLHLQHQVPKFTTFTCLKPEGKDEGASPAGMTVTSSTFYQPDLNMWTHLTARGWLKKMIWAQREEKWIWLRASQFLPHLLRQKDLCCEDLLANITSFPRYLAWLLENVPKWSSKWDALNIKGYNKAPDSSGFSNMKDKQQQRSCQFSLPF